LSSLAEWLTTALGVAPNNLPLYERALTHGSQGGPSYQRLEFLGDRVLGLTVAHWLYTAFPDEPEGQMSRRFNAVVTGQACADVARAINVGPQLRLGKQARDDGGADSDNILGDVTEALIGALYLDHGMPAAEAFIRKHWQALVEGQVKAPRHPKSALQEWAAAHNRRPPVYELIDRSGPHHAPQFTVSVTLGPAGEAQATGSSKQEAETAAAAALLVKLT
jgi:ribonuclease-3